MQKMENVNVQRLRVNEEYNGWIKCPNIECGMYIERMYGCKHIKCTNCTTNFCDCCGQQIDPLNWKKHFLPPNTCRLWEDIDDLLNDHDQFFVHDDKKEINDKFEVFEEGDIDDTESEYNSTDQVLFNENMIKQLIELGLGDRKSILQAMRVINEHNDIDVIANYLMLRKENEENCDNGSMPWLETENNHNKTVQNELLEDWKCRQCHNQCKDIYLFCPLCGMDKDDGTQRSNKEEEEEYSIHIERVYVQ